MNLYDLECDECEPILCLSDSFNTGFYRILEFIFINKEIKLW